MTLPSFKVLESAVKKSFDKLKVTAPENITRDADVEFYKHLTPEAFDVIAQVYGPDGLTQYVTAMESKLMRGKSNG